MTTTKSKYAGHTPGPWEISWFVCRMDAQDVAHAKSNGNEAAVVGDEMWRLPKSIGPLRVEHDYWAKYHLGLTEESDARLIADAPLLLAQRDALLAACEAVVSEAVEAEYDEAPSIAEFPWDLMDQLRAAIAKAKESSQ